MTEVISPIHKAAKDVPHRFLYGLLPKEDKSKGDFGPVLLAEEMKLSIKEQIEALKKEQSELQYKYYSRMEELDREICRLEDMEEDI